MWIGIGIITSTGISLILGLFALVLAEDGYRGEAVICMTTMFAFAALTGGLAAQ